LLVIGTPAKFVSAPTLALHVWSTAAARAQMSADE
jgi:hypothetical protein